MWALVAFGPAAQHRLYRCKGEEARRSVKLVRQGVDWQFIDGKLQFTDGFFDGSFVFAYVFWHSSSLPWDPTACFWRSPHTIFAQQCCPPLTSRPHRQGALPRDGSSSRTIDQTDPVPTSRNCGAA
mmetsp:Transcript_79843/g.133662  ORF Transcript_79843/g.133662 Transcript_79843/m.133662 type:complete len:126 (-) Transcript_79843:70-447(-)